MIFKDKDHYERFNEAMKRIDLNDQLAQAACYLLTYRQSVWKKVKKHLKPEVFDFDDCIFRGGGAACPAWREPRVRRRRSHPFELV